MRTPGILGTPPVVLNLIIINALFYMAQTMLPFGGLITNTLGMHYAGSPDFYLWQTVTYMFLHGNFTHLLFNMFALWMFGRQLEYDLGSRRFLIYFMVCGIGAGLLQMGVNVIEVAATDNLLQQMMLKNTLTIGASGAVFGLLLSFGLMHPNAMIVLLFPPIPMKAKYFVIIFGVIELVWGVTSSVNHGGGIAHFAHVGGMLWGFLLLRYWKHTGKIYY